MDHIEYYFVNKHLISRWGIAQIMDLKLSGSLIAYQRSLYTAKSGQSNAEALRYMQLNKYSDVLSNKPQ